jgi:peroxiredoxin
MREELKSQGFEVLAISGDSVAPMKRFAEFNKLGLPVLSDPVVREVDSAAVFGPYKAGWGTFYIVDRSGRIVYSHSGYDEHAIREALKKVGITSATM